MERETITDRRAKNAAFAAPGTRYDVWDALVPGLSLRVTDKGAKSWTVVARLNRRPLRVTLGPYPALGVQAARDRARAALEAIALGKNPRRIRLTAPTVDKALDRYVEARKDTWERDYRRNVESLFRLYVRPAFGRLLIADITRRDVIDLVSEIAEKYPARANTALAHLSGFFAWAHDRDLVGANPCARVKPPTELRSRDRVYTDPEIRAIWKACESDGLRWPYGPFVRFLLVTAQRRAQGRDMRWDEIDEARGVWTSLTKEKRRHPLPLSDLALEILAAAPRRGAYVFSATGDRGVTNMSYLAREVRACEGVPQDFRLHDLRRTAATRMAELGVAPWIVDAVLDHVAGGVTGVYQRYSYVEEMRHALGLWARRLRDILATE